MDARKGSERDTAIADCRKVFIVGCGRSGTTWLRLLLAQHSGVATTGETRLFTRYLGNLYESWQSEEQGNGRTGLSPVISENTFIATCRNLAGAVFEGMLATNPGARVIVEKTPRHAFHGPLILKLFPDAFFLHVVRDPRGVVGSLRAASRNFGRDWAPRSVAAGASLWRESVGAARSIGDLTDRYKEIHYEDLLNVKGPELLEKVFDWLGLDADARLCERFIKVCSIENLRKADSAVKGNKSRSDMREDFFRKGEAESWRRELSRSDVRIIEYLTGDLMSRYGYESAISNTGKARRKPARLFLYDALERLEWRINKTAATALARARSVT